MILGCVIAVLIVAASIGKAEDVAELTLIMNMEEGQDIH